MLPCVKRNRPTGAGWIVKVGATSQPVAEPKDYVAWLNHPQPQEEIKNIRHALRRSMPLGSESWVSMAVEQFGLENTLRNPWRPDEGTWNV